MKIARIGVVCASFMAAQGPAFGAAQQMTVGDLEMLCTAVDDGSKNACRFYILGVTEGVTTGIEIANAKDRARFCIPEGVPSSAMEFAVKKTMGEDLIFFPKDRALAAVGFIVAAMQHEFPCKK